MSIVPFSDEETLGYLLQAAARLGARSTLLVDSDKAGRSMVQKNSSQIPGLQVGTYADASGRDSSIEDLIGIDDYLNTVNEAYSGFAWFSQFHSATVRREIGGLSLGAYLEKAFRERFGRSFSKAFVAVGFVARTDAFDSTALERFARVVSDLISSLASEQDRP